MSRRALVGRLPIGIAFVVALVAALTTVAAPPRAEATPTAAESPPREECLAALDARGIDWAPAKQAGIAIAVEIHGPLGGVDWTSSRRRPLIVDCSLAVSLAEAGRYLRDLGVERAVFSSAFDVRNVRGTQRPSKHSFGLAVDLHTLEGEDIGSMRIDRDFEQGLGDAVDCIGQPLTRGGAILKIVQCQLVRSGLFYLVLSPDYDDAHHDHLHLEARPWRDRVELRAVSPAIH